MLCEFAASSRSPCFAKRSRSAPWIQTTGNRLPYLDLKAAALASSRRDPPQYLILPRLPVPRWLGRLGMHDCSCASRPWSLSGCEPHWAVGFASRAAQGSQARSKLSHFTGQKNSERPRSPDRLRLYGGSHLQVFVAVFALREPSKAALRVAIACARLRLMWEQPLQLCG